MNIYKNLLFLHGYLLDPKVAEDDFGPTYGNRVASEKALRAPWQPERDLTDLVAKFEGSDLPAVEPCGCG
jgi:hypothetical protein